MRVSGLTIGLMVAAAGVAFAQTAPVPRPFPGSTTAPAGTTTTKPAPPEAAAPAASQPAAAEPAAPVPAPASPAAAAPDVAGVPIYPSAEYLETFDAGSGQRYVLYGTNLPYADTVAYYRTVLKNGGRELYRAPATHQFDIGRFQEDRMAFPPGVVVKDYTWNNSAGYLFVSGTTEKRYKTIIQIVPPSAAR